MGKAERTRQHIITSSAPLFNKKGIAGTSIDDVLEASKVAKGCLYGHFESKEALSHEIVDYLLKRLSDKSTTAMANEKTAVKKLFAFLDIYKSPGDFVSEGGCPILNFAVESDDTNPVIRQKVSLMIHKSLKAFSGIIQDGIKNSELSDALDPDEFALKIFTMIEGGIMVARATASSQNMHKIIEIIKKEIKSYALS